MLDGDITTFTFVKGMNGRLPFVPTVACLGQLSCFLLTNSPATFQAIMNEILHDFITAGHGIVYLDDILNFTAALVEHRHHQVLRCLQEHQLYLKEVKCFFESPNLSNTLVLSLAMDSFRLILIKLLQSPPGRSHKQERIAVLFRVPQFLLLFH